MRIVHHLYLALIPLLFAVAAPAHTQGTTDGPAILNLSSDRIAELKASIDVDDLWNSMEQPTVRSGDAIAIVRLYDIEAAPLMGDRSAVGLVMVGVLGTGTVPVALNLYGMEHDKLRVVSGVSARSFVLSLGGGRDIQVRVDDSNYVLIDGIVVGRIG